MSKKNNQANLFESKEWWEKEWQGMPEFIQDDLTSWKSIIVHFKNKNDMDDFSNLIGQRLLSTTKSIWYPKAEIGRYADKRYLTDES